MRYENEKCPVCGEAFKADDDVVVCPYCATPHHRNCYNELGKCANEEKHKEGFVWQKTSDTPPIIEEKTEEPKDYSVCVECGTKNKKNALVCSNCGSVINAEIRKELLPQNVNSVFVDGRAVDNNEFIDEENTVSVKEAASFIQKNRAGYIKVFLDSKRTKRNPKFNFAAFLLGPYWFFFRKMYDFEPKHHVDLCLDLGLIDYERGVKLAGAGNWMYTGLGARLEWALLNYFIDTHIADGYDFILPPHMLEYQCGETAGQFPKFADEVYKIGNPTDDRVHFMLPTAEAALASFYRDEIISEADLPKKFFAYSPCFRREAGSHRADERGMVRGHQFNKVEMFQFTTPEGSDAAFDELVTKAEKLVENLGFHFRTVKLAAGDCSASMCRTYDIEILIPSMDGYKEVSSVSNARDYQARRGNARFRREATGKPEFLHSLNGSGLATSRIFPALVEQNQRADGSIVIPEVLRKYMGGMEIIEKK